MTLLMSLYYSPNFPKDNAMRPIIKSIKTNADNVPTEYKHWTDAKIDLVNELGDFCSYCEKQVNKSSLHVEHIYAKAATDENGKLKYSHLQYRWDNFLLACSHCNSIKGNHDIALTNPFLPHQNNVLHFIEVIDGGLIKIKDTVAGDNLKRAGAFINLVGLDREPSHSHYSEKDDRWQYRLSAKDIAQRYFEKYISVPQQTDIQTIVDLAKSIGFFSVWYYQFRGYNEVLDALIHGITVDDVRIQPFKGTHTDSFRLTDYATLERP